MSRQDYNDNCGNPNDSLTGRFEYSTELSTKGLRLDWLQHQLMNESTPHRMHLQYMLHQTIQHRASRTVSTWPLFQMGLSRTTGWMSVSLPWHTIISPVATQKVAKDKTHMGKHSILTQKLQQPRGCDWLVANNSSRCFFGKQTSKQELGSRKKGVSTRVFLKTRTMNAKPGEEDSIRGLLILLQKEKVVICPQCRLLSAAFGILQQHGAQHTCAL